eukprot:121444-Chlamydomonas_euryale.AAC.1
MLVNAHSFSMHKTTASGQFGPIVGRGKTLLLYADCDPGVMCDRIQFLADDAHRRNSVQFHGSCWQDVWQFPAAGGFNEVPRGAGCPWQPP